jgi:hypothetical protein
MLNEPLYKTFVKTLFGQCIFLPLSLIDSIGFICQIRVNTAITGKTIERCLLDWIEANSHKRLK